MTTFMCEYEFSEIEKNVLRIVLMAAAGNFEYRAVTESKPPYWAHVHSILEILAQLDEPEMLVLLDSEAIALAYVFREFLAEPPVVETISCESLGLEGDERESFIRLNGADAIHNKKSWMVREALCKKYAGEIAAIREKITLAENSAHMASTSSFCFHKED